MTNAANTPETAMGTDYGNPDGTPPEQVGSPPLDESAFDEDPAADEAAEGTDVYAEPSEPSEPS